MKEQPLKQRALEYHGSPGILMTMRDGSEYTRTDNGQIVRTNRDHRTKKERNRYLRLRRATNELV